MEIMDVMKCDILVFYWEDIGIDKDLVNFIDYM